MDSKSIFCFVCRELQKPGEIHDSRPEYPLDNVATCNIWKALLYSWPGTRRFIPSLFLSSQTTTQLGRCRHRC